MSQRGSASLPVSRASSQSPQAVPPSSIRAAVPIPPSAHDVPHNPDHSPHRVVSGDGSRLRSYDAHRVMLNPFDSGVEGSNLPSGNPRSGSEPPPIPSGHGRVLSGPSATATHYQQQQQPPTHAYYHRSSLGVNVASPQTERSRLGVPGLDRASPTAVSPPPALNNPRTGSASQPSRARSMQNPISRGTEGFYIPSTLPSLAGTKRPFEGDTKHGTASPPTRALQPFYSGPQEAPPTSLPAASMLQNTPSRSFSQPVHPGGYQHSSSVPPGAWPQQHHPSQIQAGWEQGSGYGASLLPAVRESQPLAPVARAPLSAPGTPSAPGSGLSRPEAGWIPVVVDTTSGSGAQTKKRKKNAEASSRHRKGKQAERQKLEQEVEYLRQQLREIQQERDAYKLEAEECRRELYFYRRERDRLPEDSARPHQQGPPPSAHAMTQAGYPTRQTPDAAEREPGPRRLDRTPDLGGVPYSQRSQQQRQTPTHEPLQPSVGFPYAMPSPRPELGGYTMPLSRPASASSAETLPPLRSIGGAAMEPGAPQAQRQHYGGRATYETGFLHAPREPPREPAREPEGGWSQR